MIRAIRNTALVCLMSSTSAISQNLPEEFFGFNDLIEKEEIYGKAVKDIPIFPILGDPSSPVKIDYFYSATCVPCRDSSSSIFRAISDNEPIQVSFHPIVGNQEDYDRAVAESVLNSSSPLAFSLYHFMSLGPPTENTLSAEELFIQSAEYADVAVSSQARMNNYQDWIKNIEVSREIAENIGIESLPTMVIGNRKYEGFVDHSAFINAIRDVSNQGEQ